MESNRRDQGMEALEQANGGRLTLRAASAGSPSGNADKANGSIIDICGGLVGGAFGRLILAGTAVARETVTRKKS